MKLRLIIFILMAAACGPKAPTPETSGGQPASAGPLVVSCCGDSDAGIMEAMRRYEATPEAQQTADIAVFPFRSNSGVTARDRIVVHDDAAWAKLWSTIAGAQLPPPKRPTVDFSRETIVVASMGEQRSGGFSVTIDSAGVEGETVVLAVTERSPGPTCGTTAALTQPLALARILRPNAKVRFVEKRVVTDCG